MSAPWSLKGSKGTIINNDEFLILDSADANPATKNKRVTLSVLKAATSDLSLPLSGGAVSGDIIMGGNAIQGLADAILPQDPITKGVFDSLSSTDLTDSSNLARVTTVNNYTAGVRQNFLGLLAGTAGINVGAIAGNPTTQVNGDIWLNSSTNTLFARINGVDIDLGDTGSSGITTINSDSTAAQIIAAGTGLGIVDATNTHTLSVAAGVHTEITGLGVQSQALDMGNNEVNNFLKLIQNGVSEITPLGVLLKPTPDGSLVWGTVSSAITEIIDSTGDGSNSLSATLAITADLDDNIFVGGEGSNNIFKITPDNVITQIADNSDGILDPGYLITDLDGNLFVANASNVLKITPSGVISEIIGPSDGISSPYAMAVDKNGNIYVTDNILHEAWKITPSGIKTKIIDSTGDGTNSLSIASGIGVDNAGNVFVAGGGSNNAFKITPQGGITQIIDSTGDGSNSLTDPQYLAVDPTGNVIVSGLGSDNAFKITPSGTITEIIDSTGDGSNSLIDGGALATDKSGNVCVAGGSSHNVFRITPSGTITEIIDSTGDGSNPLTGPLSMAIDITGNILVGGISSNNAFKIVLENGEINSFIPSKDKLVQKIGDVHSSTWQEIGGEVNTVFGRLAELSVSTSDGFIHIPSMDGIPTGIPTIYPGKIPQVYNIQDGLLYSYINNQWVAGIAIKVNDTLEFFDGSTQEIAATPNSITWNVATAQLNQTLSISSQDTSPRDVFLSPDGLKAWMLGESTNALYEYDLSIAGEISSGVYSGNSFDVTTLPPSGTEGFSQGFNWSHDGHTLWILGGNFNRIYQLNVPTAFSIASIVDSATFFGIGSQTGAATGVFVNASQTKVYVSSSVPAEIFEYDMLIKKDITSLVYNNVHLDVSSVDTAPRSVILKPDGKKLYFNGVQNDNVCTYNLSIPHSLATAVHIPEENLNINPPEGFPTGIFINGDGGDIYVVGQGTDTIYQYRLGISTKGNIIAGSRILETQGANVASATNITLGAGNTFLITGTTTINTIDDEGWGAGSKVTLYFDSSITLNNGTGVNALELAQGSSFNATSGSSITLVFINATNNHWREVARVEGV